MTIEAIAKNQAKYAVDGPMGEAIEYRSFPDAFVDGRGIVRDQVIDLSGELVGGAFEIVVDKIGVPRVQVGRDQVRLPAGSIRELERVGTVKRVLERGKGAWRLLCIE